jgi:uncharacterized membrane protein YfcA
MTGAGMVVTGLLLGLVAGVLSGMFGIGGGLIIVPALILIFNESPRTAIGTSLFALMWPVGLLGVLEYWRNGHLRPALGALIAVGLFIGAYFGARVTLSISTATMKRSYAVFLLIVGLYFLITTRDAPKSDVEITPSNPASNESTDQVH